MSLIVLHNLMVHANENLFEDINCDDILKDHIFLESSENMQPE